MNGVIKEWNVALGQGIVAAESGELLRFSTTDILENDLPEVGLPVKFDVAQESGTVRAANVRIGGARTGGDKVERFAAVVIADIRLPWLSVVRLLSQVAVVGFSIWLAFRLAMLAVGLVTSF